MSKYDFKTKIEYEFPNYIGYRNFDYMSRYSNIRMIYDKSEKSTFFESVNKSEIDYSNNDCYYTVTDLTENRLDIIAYKYYNNPTYWWIIAMVNNISDPFKLKRGTTLRIPPLTTALSSEVIR